MLKDKMNLRDPIAMDHTEVDTSNAKIQVEECPDPDDIVREPKLLDASSHSKQPGKLRINYRDNGSIPSYLSSFSDVFECPPEESRSFRHCLSGKRAASSSHQGPKGDDFQNITKPQHTPMVDYSSQLHPATHGISTSLHSIADIFLEKVLNPNKATTSQRMMTQAVKKLEERWPPRPRSSTKSTSVERGIEPKVCQEASGTNERKQLETVQVNTKSQEEEAPTLTAGTSETSISSQKDNEVEEGGSTSLRHEEYDDDSTISSKGFEDMRPSYKIHYSGPGALKLGREWEDGVVDASFPAMPRYHGDDDGDELLSDDQYQGESLGGQLPATQNLSRFDSGPGKRPDSMPGLPRIDRRFDALGKKSEHSLPGIPSMDRRFRPEKTSDAPHKPGRQNSIISPAVWQTRVSEAAEEETDSVARKWRLKRVWEMDDEIVDESEPAVVVFESNLKKTLTAMLCESKTHSHDETPANTPSTSVSNIKNVDNSKHWKIQKVWDCNGHIVAVDDAASLGEDEMIQIFESDDFVAKDRDHLDIPTAEALKNSKLLNGNEVAATHDDDNESIGVDDLLAAQDDDLGKSSHDPEALKEKLILAQKEIKDAMANSSDSALSQNKIGRLQDKISSCMDKMEKAEFRRYQESVETLDTSFFNESYYDDSQSTGSPPDFEGGEESFRGKSLIRRKLKKVQKRMTKMMKKGGEEVKEHATFKSLQRKRQQYLQELVEIKKEEGHSSTISHDSVRFDLDMDVIQEEGNLELKEPKRDRVLIERKLHKAVKSLKKMLEEKGPGIAATSRYQRVLEKRDQYRLELGPALSDQ